MQKIEEEVKIQLEHPQLIIEHLRDNGAIFLGATLEKTIRVDTCNLDLEEKGIFLRVRSGFNNTITMKEKISEDIITRKRLETEFEIEDIDKMQYIFRKIGLSFFRIMEKYRMKWSYENVSIVVDELPFGIFMEIEAEKSRIDKIVSDLGLEGVPQIVDTYWALNDSIGSAKPDIRFPQDYKLLLMNF